VTDFYDESYPRAVLTVKGAADQTLNIYGMRRPDSTLAEIQADVHVGTAKMTGQPAFTVGQFVQLRGNGGKVHWSGVAWVAGAAPAPAPGPAPVPDPTPAPAPMPGSDYTDPDDTVTHHDLDDDGDTDLTVVVDIDDDNTEDMPG
jgi:hypothetical protein